MYIIIDKLIELFANQEPILPSNRMGVKIPTNQIDVPAIVMSLTVDTNNGIGLGKYIRSGNTPAEHTKIIEVTPGPETFTEALQTLRIWPLPLMQNPSSSQKEFTENDIKISNVMDLSNPIQYKLVNEPINMDQFKLDLLRAEIVFGEPQKEGEKLQVVHWTVIWKNEIHGERYKGLVHLEIWGNNLNELNQISQNLQSRLNTDRALSRRKGFLILKPASLEAAENVKYTPASGSPFSLWKQKLAFYFTFEVEEGGELSSGIPIKRIDVDLKPPAPEEFSIPLSTNKN